MYEAILKNLRAGITFGEIYEAAAQVYRRNNLEKMLPGRFGHGIGLSAHELPGIVRDSNQIILPNMIFTVEPGLTHKEWGGTRISETVLIKDNGYEILTKSNADITRLSRYKGESK